MPQVLLQALPQRSRVAMGKRLEVLEREAAAQRKIASQAKPGQQVGTGSVKITEPSSKGQTRDKVGAAVGMSGPTYQRAGAMPACLPDFGRGKKSFTVNDFGIDWNQSHRWQLLAVDTGTVAGDDGGP